MKIILTIIYILTTTINLYSCSCIGKSTVENAFKSYDLIIVGKVINRKEIKIYSDTFSARRYYESQKDFQNKFKNFEEYLDKSLYVHTLIEYTVVTSKIYKGKQSDTIFVRTGRGNGDCGYRFVAGEEYLIYGKRYEETIYIDGGNRNYKTWPEAVINTSICTRTALLSEGIEDIKLLDELK